MRLHLDDRQETQMCLAVVIAVMLLAGSAIFYMGAQYHVGTHTIARMPPAMPL